MLAPSTASNPYLLGYPLATQCMTMGGRGQSTPDWIGAKKGSICAALRYHSINLGKLYQHLMEMSIKMQVQGDIDNPPGPLYNAGGIPAWRESADVL